MNQIFFSSTLMWSAALPELFRAAREFQAEGIELWAQQFDSRGYREAECLSLLDRCPLPIFVHSKTWDLNFASVNRRIRRASLDEIRNSIDLAAKLHARELTVHPPRESLCGNRPLYQELAYRGLEEIFRYASRSGVSVSLEMMEKIPKEIMTTPDDVREITRGLYREFSYTVDVAHCDNEKELFNHLRDLPKVSKIHISNRRGATYHTLLSDGDFSFRRLWPALEHSGCPMVIEGFDASGQYTMLRENMKYIKKLKENLQ
ncbi:hypothetical protein CAFE_19060 [Caprobacter fermentans]|uniref:Xylose isomerase-like TIM barrel domain-containing protein n=1 Tax=Caproicibacter fermentans TaxID=2576756 RepID=A0A6N8HZX1_9FIRM|nr:hypothetical protein [Caproicibacter fermentans]